MKVWEGLNRLELVEKLVREGSYKSEVSFTPPMVEEAEPTPLIIIEKHEFLHASRQTIKPMKWTDKKVDYDALINSILGWKL